MNVGLKNSYKEYWGKNLRNLNMTWILDDITGLLLILLKLQCDDVLTIYLGGSYYMRKCIQLNLAVRYQPSNNRDKYIYIFI